MISIYFLLVLLLVAILKVRSQPSFIPTADSIFKPTLSPIVATTKKPIIPTKQPVSFKPTIAAYTVSSFYSSHTFKHKINVNQLNI